MTNSEDSQVLEGIAIIGMAGRFPGAKNIDEFWQNLQNGVESISFFSDRELEASGIAPTLFDHPNYVKAKGVIDDVEWFDASFFGFNPREAEVTDPQHRLFLESAWEALENAGYNPETYEGAIGVYGGVSQSTYLLNNLMSRGDIQEKTGNYQLLIGNDKDFLTTRISYKLNLKGPSLSVQTACSTSLVATALACQSLLTYQCDMALAGGASISFPQKSGYLYQQGMILSPDGHCRAFDASSQGTISGSGVGIVVLKRLEDAIADGDFIHAVIRGSAINNDGSLKVGYTAPSIEGQAEAIATAQALAEVDPETITYIETHGTGTPLGDPIEIAALTEVFRTHTNKKNFCAIASVKTNIGHLDAAAGIAGLIKTVEALKHQLIPPNLHFQQPNPQIDFANSPFYVNTTLSQWQTNGTPRRAGVSSFGIGGTNVHVILEEAPVRNSPLETRFIASLTEPQNTPYQLLLLSAKTPSALDKTTANLSEHLQQHPELNLADVAYTLAVGRKAFPHRRIVVATDSSDAANAFKSPQSSPVFTQFQESRDRPVVFMFSGQGSQYVNMARELYHSEPTFRSQIDRCCELLQPHLGFDLRDILYPSDDAIADATEKLKQTAITQPALFAIEYALAKLWMSWGIQPVAAIGHSIGEYVAACIASVFSLEDALSLVAKRGKLMQQMPPGSMLAVPLSEVELQSELTPELSLATINNPSNCVVSGTFEAIAAFQQKLGDRGLECRTLHTSHAFHSPMMEPMLDSFTEAVQNVTLNPPKIPYVSNVTGTWITGSEATNPDYWAQHLRQTVRFSEGLETLFQQSDCCLLEVGPGRTLTTLAKRHPNKGSDRNIISSLRHPQDQQSDISFLLNALGRLWIAGVNVNWSEFYAGERRYRVPLPTYPFERQRYWIEPQKPVKSNLQLSQTSVTPQIWTALVEAGLIQSQQRLSEFDNPITQKKQQELEELCAAYINRSLSELGAFSNPTDKYSVPQLIEKFHILPRYEQLLSRCLNALVDRGQLQQEDSMFTQFVPLSNPDFNALLERVRNQWRDTPDTLTLVECSGNRYAAILTGKEDPLKLLFTGSTYDALQRLYQDSPESHYYIGIMRASLQALVKSWPANVPLRILEVGAGTGSATIYLLPELPPERTTYTFTDVGPLFVKQAQQKFSAYPFVEYRVLDMDRDPISQGYSPHSFDLIVASQVLHATRNLSKTLDRVRSLLAPGGVLMMWEGTNPRAFSFDVIFPLLQPIEEDELRSLYAFLSVEQWNRALHKHGFAEVKAFPETEALRANIFIAQTTALSADSPATSVPVAAESTLAPDSISASKQTPSNLGNYIAPRNDRERTIASVWQQYLGIQTISIHDDFFDLGGDSLVAVQLLNKLREMLKVELPNHSLLEAPTIAQLTEFIANASQDNSAIGTSQPALPASLVKIKSGTSKQALFLIHPAGGHVYFYRDLARHVDSKLPVYGLQARGLDGTVAPLSEVKAMASYYLEAIRLVQPEGPYLLGGSSFGGTVAFEMAQQLQAIGEPVKLLAIVDTGGTDQLPASFEDDDVEILCYQLALGANVSVSSDRLRELEPEQRLRYFLEQVGNSMGLPSDFGLNEIERYFEIFKMNVRAMRRYEMQPYSGKILFFRARERDSVTPSHPERAWVDLAAGGIEIHTIPGNHITMNFPPNVQIMAEKLMAYLNESPSVR